MTPRTAFAVMWALGTTYLLLAAIALLLFLTKVEFFSTLPPAWWLPISALHAVWGVRQLRIARGLWLHPPITYEQYLNSVLDKPLPRR